MARYHRGRAEVSGFNVADMAVEGKLAEALEQLRWALSTGVAPVLIVSAMAGACAASAKVSGAPRNANENQLAGRLGMPPWKIRNARRQLERLGPGGPDPRHPGRGVGGRTGQGRRNRPGLRPGEHRPDHRPQPKRPLKGPGAGSPPILFLDVDGPLTSPFEEVSTDTEQPRSPEGGTRCWPARPGSGPQARRPAVRTRLGPPPRTTPANDVIAPVLGPARSGPTSPGPTPTTGASFTGRPPRRVGPEARPSSGSTTRRQIDRRWIARHHPPTPCSTRRPRQGSPIRRHRLSSWPRPLGTRRAPSSPPSVSKLVWATAPQRRRPRIGSSTRRLIDRTDSERLLGDPPDLRVRLRRSGTIEKRRPRSAR